MVTYNQLIKTVKQYKPRSAWQNGVKEYALQLLVEYVKYNEDIKMSDKVPEPRVLEKKLLHGASDWSEYSGNGEPLVYNIDIAERLCSPSELKKVMSAKYGLRNPNSREDWIDCQARALYQAFNLIKETYRNLNGGY